MPALEDDENPELRRLPAPLLVDAAADRGRHRAGHVRPPPAAGSTMATQSWIELVLTLPIVLWAGWPFFVRGAQSVVNRSPNMWTLIGLGTGAAFVYSVVATRGAAGVPGLVRVHGPRGGVLRGRGRDHLADAARPDARTARRARRPRRRSSRCSGWRRRPRGASTPTAAKQDVPLDARACRRPAARAAGREGAGRRRGDRGQQRGRRIDADRRADAGDQARRRQADRRDAQHQRRAGDALRARRLGRPCWRRSCRWWRRRSARARRCSAWPTWWPATSSSASSASPC